eukprot:1074304-Pleurochrysis_carterae.AAC.5
MEVEEERTRLLAGSRIARCDACGCKRMQIRLLRDPIERNKFTARWLAASATVHLGHVELRPTRPFHAVTERAVITVLARIVRT